jgi:hypothetical protein
MNVQLRIITDDNVDQLLSMSYSDNAAHLMQIPTRLSQIPEVFTPYAKDDYYLHDENKDLLQKAIYLHQKTTNNLLDLVPDLRGQAGYTPEVVALGKDADVVPDETNEMPDQFKPQNILKITSAQKAYKLEPGEVPEMLEVTPEMLENPTLAMYIKITMPDGSTQHKHKYPPPYDLITMLSKNDQRWLIQQPMAIQHKILLEIRDKYGSALMEQKRLFAEGKVKTPFINLPPVSATESLKTSDSIEWATGSPAYVPNSDSPAYRNPDSPTYNPASPAYNPNASVSPAYNPNASASPAYNPNASPAYNPNASPAYNPNATTTDSSVFKPGPPYPAPPQEPESILKVDEAKETEKEVEEEKKKDDSSENKKIIITKGADDSSLSTNSDSTKKISL